MRIKIVFGFVTGISLVSLYYGIRVFSGCPPTWGVIASSPWSCGSGRESKTWKSTGRMVTLRRKIMKGLGNVVDIFIQQNVLHIWKNPCLLLLPLAVLRTSSGGKLRTIKCVEVLDAQIPRHQELLLQLILAVCRAHVTARRILTNTHPAALRGWWLPVVFALTVLFL